MTIPQRILNAIENMAGGQHPECQQQLISMIEQHCNASPWTFSHHGQPDVGVEVITADEEDGKAVYLSTSSRGEGDDWTDPEGGFWWMHIPPLPKEAA